jgi:superfamily II DNA or RNA helicase
MSLVLRDYQRDALARVDALFESGTRRVCLVIPTGGGKTATAVMGSMDYASRGRRVLWLAHRVELVDQAANTFRRLGADVGVVAAERPGEAVRGAPIQVASVQTLAAGAGLPPADLIVQDEAHTVAIASTWAEVAGRYPEARVLGLTATPTRGDGVGLKNVFDDLVVGCTTKELIAAGHLVPLELVAPERMLQPTQLAQDPEAAYIAHADGAQAIVFAQNTRAANVIVQRLHAKKISADVVLGELGSRERDAKLDRFRAGELRVLVNVYVLTEGFDVPDVSCVILARGCSHPGMLVQMAGRGMRTAPGKTKCTLIDLRGVTHVHGRPDEDYVYSLDGLGMRAPGRKAEAFCLVCGAVVEPAVSICGMCGRIKPELMVPRAVGKRLLYQQKMNRVPQQRRVYMLAHWIREARSKGWNQRAPYVRFKKTFGDWPDSAIIAEATAVASRKG